jgi:hypothetical protein
MRKKQRHLCCPLHISIDPPFVRAILALRSNRVLLGN